MRVYCTGKQVTRSRIGSPSSGPIGLVPILDNWFLLVIVLQGLAGYDLLEESMVKMARRCSFFFRQNSDFRGFTEVSQRFDMFDCRNE